ncbi:cupin domain-containing protein [Acidaminobacter sp. JC074]|uniref:helix-turn-helix domain-containing protein n=1 Tax=Acidaminobacter sp. JC074 TaxID=2530199 RepID=UPI001F0D3EA5|nr:XRE family transcriptional regulator [Acidaminobacter sp. JC074]MCH4889800.1 cupin domain-containing protein [Acidaminobacter sp. JC074]
MSIGEKIKNMRLTHSLTQEELADRCELSKSFISLLERDLTSPSIATLTDILDVFNTSLEDFFSQKKTEQYVFTKEDVFVKESDEDGVEINWLVYNAQKNEMEPILVKLQPDSVLFDEDAHHGEEFGYVMSGIVMVDIKGKTFKVKKGESFYYKADIPHKVYNDGKNVATILMVSSPPSF